MSKTIKIFSSVILIVLLLSACAGFGGAEKNDPDTQALVMTAAHETMQAVEAANNAGDDGGGDSAPDATEPPATDIPATDIPPTDAPTNTPVPPTPTPTPICNMAQFDEDLSIPDETVLAPGEAFTKIWRIKNVGVCTWSVGYQIIFDDGDEMGAPLSFGMPSVVAPNGTVDIAVDMIAPATEGTFQGDWKLRSEDGIEFGLGDGSSFYVRIITAEPTATLEPTATTGFITIFPLPVTMIPIFGINTELINTQSGAVSSAGGLSSSPAVGDNLVNDGINAFFKFDLSSIPDGATINSALFGVNSYTSFEDPFGDLACMRAYDGIYFPLDASDYGNHPSTGTVVRFCDTDELDAPGGNTLLVDAVQSNLVSDFVDFIFVFNNNETDGNNDGDYLVLGTVSLIINYSP